MTLADTTCKLPEDGVLTPKHVVILKQIYSTYRHEYQEYFLGVKIGRCVRLTALPPSWAIVTQSGNLNFLEPSGPLQVCNGTTLPFIFIYAYVDIIIISNLSKDRSKASSKTIPPHSAI